MTMNERIKIVRKSQKLTQKEFGQKLTVSDSYISRLESGKETPTDMLLKLISFTFNISFDWLTSESGDMYIDSFDPDKIRHLENLSDLFSNIQKNINNLPEHAMEFAWGILVELNIILRRKNIPQQHKIICIRALQEIIFDFSSFLNIYSTVYDKYDLIQTKERAKKLKATNIKKYSELLDNLIELSFLKN